MAELNLDKIKIKLLVGSTKDGNKIVELLQGFDRKEIPEDGSYEESLITAYLAAFDILESLIMAHASNGIDVTSEAYQDGVQTALDAFANNS